MTEPEYTMVDMSQIVEPELQLVVPDGQKRGFAAMNKERLLELASKSGHSASARGVAHKWTSIEAREAGRKGGLARAAKRVTMAETSTTESETK
jgi:general stress protein YciG